MATIILGAQWGDEGKGKLVDSELHTARARLVARAAGGHNAGHSIRAQGVSYDFHLLPSGLVAEHCKVNLIGSGVVFHVPTFFSELAVLEKKGLKNVHDRIFVSDRVSINLDLHIAVDGLEEGELGSRKIGTTRRGIGPAYASKAARTGIKLAEVFDAETFERKLRHLHSGYAKRYGDLLQYDVEDELKRFQDYRVSLAKYTVDAVALVKDAQDKNTEILIEGANALMLDVDYGTYPYVTSSNTGLGGIFTGLAIDPRKIREIVGTALMLFANHHRVVKAYTTRVGEGPFATEDTAEAGTKLQDIGREWGVSTGRKRRCGWLDLVVVKYSTAINHYTALNLTKLDVLDSFEKIKIAVGYKDPQTGEELASFPASLEQLGRVEVVYHEMPGWNTPITHIKTYTELPKEARDYVEFIETFIGVKIKWIGTGPDRGKTDPDPRPLPLYASYAFSIVPISGTETFRCCLGPVDRIVKIPISLGGLEY
ncbi:adenylosuccinate synthase activity protein [Cryphonectria parasitica EP155]|uniref:Adenylosuccinate synthetase n=1 Tax=Cryphonectria parasitica (strain ATCC 38755 / EP155) TaxID=660469 RepID=A0A9P5CMR4_CRYP1|nr:adenylosuccinate synthase activity protein [Cryphonectria parasitica EP155]KAF3763532.1 adenylosuccinate synthase activity protein [Cryphonectria parasitica EP155]